MTAGDSSCRFRRVTPTLTTLSTTSSSVVVLDEDLASRSALARFFPEGCVDASGQPLDARNRNSWTMTLADVPLGEAAECFAINALAPLSLCSRLKPTLQRKARAFVINVSAMEAKFHRLKTFYHPHTNAAKAALNMLTRTSAADYARDCIFMSSVDTGWVNDERPLPDASRIPLPDPHRRSRRRRPHPRPRLFRPLRGERALLRPFPRGLRTDRLVV